MTKRGNVIPLRPHAVVAGERLQTLERIDQFQLYDLACAVHPLVELDDDTSHVKALGRLAVASKKLDELLSDDPPARLTVIARPAAEDLRTKVNELVCTSAADRKKRRLTASEAEPFADSDLMPVRKAAERFEIALQSEMAASVAFVVPKRGIFDTDELVNYASRSLPAEFKAFMPDKAHNEITSAGRCLAFGLYSAVGFHICRAVEAVMEAY